MTRTQRIADSCRPLERAVAPIVRGLFIVALAALTASGSARSAHASTPTDALARVSRLLPRDTHVLLFVEDRAAFARRVARTDVLRAFDTVGDSSLEEALDALKPQFRALLPIEVVAGASWLFARGDGPVALGVDGFVKTERGFEPDYVVIADAHGLNGLASTLRFLATDSKRDDALDALETFDLPFELDDDVRVAFTSHRGLELLEIDDEIEGHHFALCQVGDILIAGRSVAKVRDAADCALDDSYASLAQNRRFQTFWRNVGGENGALFCFLDVRRVRQSIAAFAIGNWMVRAALEGPFGNADGFAASLRAVGTSFECHAFIEHSATITSAGSRDANSRTASAAQQPQAFKFSARIGQRIAAVDARIATAGEAGLALFEFGVTTGAMQLPNLVPPKPDELLGPLGPKLAPLVGGEFAIAQLAQDNGGEFLPRLVFALEVKDMDRVRDLFEANSNRFMLPGVLLRELSEINDGYEFVIANNTVFARPAVALRGDFLIGAPSIAALRDVLDDAEHPLGSAPEFLEALDRLDVNVDAPSTRWIYVHPEHFVESSSTWYALLHRWPDLLDRAGEDEEVVDSMRELFGVLVEWVDDPDVAESFHGTLLRFDEFDGGTHVRFVGP
jgi:hypothetical protein